MGRIDREDALPATRPIGPFPSAEADAPAEATRLLAAATGQSVSLAEEFDPEDPELLPPGTSLLRGQYRILSFLGAGGFGITYLALDSLERQVVIKECFPTALCQRRGTMVEVRRKSDRRDFAQLVAHFEAEARRLAHLDHPNIVGVHQVFADNGTAYFALDLIRGQTLSDLIQTAEMPPAAVKVLLLQLLDALTYLHSRGILHRDIAPDNILLRSSGEPVLIDFGAAKSDSSHAGNPTALNTVKDGYSPPEFYFSGSAQAPASDLYSLAATFYHVITGAAPPDALTRSHALAQGAPDPLLPLSDYDRRFDRWFTAALNAALSLNPSQRPARAEAWIDQIHEARRRQAALEKAKDDSRIEASILRLVAETNQAVEADLQQLPPVESAEPPPPPARETAQVDFAALQVAPTELVEAEAPAPAPRRKSLVRRIFSRVFSPGRAVERN